MSFQHVKIAGFLKDRTRPLFDGSKACRVVLVLSPSDLPSPWVKSCSDAIERSQLKGRAKIKYVRSDATPGVEQEIQALRLETDPDVFEEDLAALKRIVISTNSQFQAEFGSAQRAQDEIIKMLEVHFPAEMR